MSTSATQSKLNVQEIPLSNGSVLYYQHFEGAPRVAFSIYVHGGNRIEPAPGVADILNDLLSEGTTKRDAEQIAIEMDGLSLDMDTDTRRDYSIMSATFLDEDLEASMEFLSDMLFHSTLSEFEKEKVRLHGELVMEMDSPRNRSHDLLMTTLFKGTPYQASHSKILETLPLLTSPDSLITHYNDVYQPQNILFSAVGDIDAETLKTQIERYFTRGTGKNWSDVNPPQALSQPKDEYVTGAKDDSNQLHIFKGWFAPRMSHPDYPAIVVLNTILGGAGLTSRLFLELRDKQGLAYNVRSQYESSKFAGLFTIYIGTEPNNRDKVLKGFEIECQKLMDNPVGHTELEEAKENVLGRRVVFLETAPQLCSYIGNQMALGIPMETIDAVPEKIQAITALQVQEMAQKYLSQPAVIAAVGPSSFL